MPGQRVAPEEWEGLGRGGFDDIDYIDDGGDYGDGDGDDGDGDGYGEIW